MSGRKTPSLDRVRAFIESERAKQRPFPTQAKIAEHMGWKHLGSARDALCRLATYEHIAIRVHNQRRVEFDFLAIALTPTRSLDEAARR